MTGSEVVCGEQNTLFLINKTGPFGEMWNGQNSPCFFFWGGTMAQSEFCSEFRQKLGAAPTKPWDTEGGLHPLRQSSSFNSH